MEMKTQAQSQRQTSIPASTPASTLIRGATLYDGTGDRPFQADVLLTDGVIAAIGAIPPTAAQLVVEGHGLVLTPGFINPHSHFELQLFLNPDTIPVLAQGITTEVLGQDGSSVAPVSDACLQELQENMAPLCGTPPRPYWWRSYAQYMQAVAHAAPAARYVGLVGYGTLRMHCMGSANRAPTAEEQQRICALLEQCLQEGARGLSLGMIYPPCSYASTAELVTVCKVLVQYDGVLMVHTRNELDKLVESFEEMVEVVQQTGVRLHISHLKSMGKANWGRVKTILARMEVLNAAGYDIGFDQYPWTATSTGLKVVPPAWAYAGGEDAFQARLETPTEYNKILAETSAQLEARGGASAVQIATVLVPGWAWMCGLRLDAVAEKLGMAPPQAVLHLLKASRSAILCVYHSICEEDVQAVMQSPYHTLCTDGIVGALPHPRAYSSFPRFLGRYVRDLKVIPLETAIRNITYEPARRLRLWDRGLIRVGLSADLVLLDYARVQDTNSYAEPKKLPTGICKVWVQGVLRYQEGQQLG